MFCTANYLVILLCVGSFRSDIRSAPSLGVSPFEEDSQDTAGM